MSAPPPSFCIAVVGSRTFTYYDHLATTLDRIIADDCPAGAVITIVSGGAAGADRLAARYARARGLTLVELVPEWHRYGRAAAIVRNGDIVERADLVVAFWDGASPGTRDSIDRAKAAGKRVVVFPF